MNRISTLFRPTCLDVFLGAAVELNGRWRWSELDSCQSPAATWPCVEPSHRVAVLWPHPQDGTDQGDLHLQVHHQELYRREDGITQFKQYPILPIHVFFSGGNPKLEERTDNRCLPHWHWGEEKATHCRHQEHLWSRLRLELMHTYRDGTQYHAWHYETCNPCTCKLVKLVNNSAVAIWNFFVKRMLWAPHTVSVYENNSQCEKSSRIYSNTA